MESFGVGMSLEQSVLGDWPDKPPRLPRLPLARTPSGGMPPSSLPDHFPIPETWGWEMEYIVGTLCDSLDIAKTHGCLMISTNCSAQRSDHMASATSLDRLARLCREAGSAALIRYVTQKFPSGYRNALHSCLDSPTGQDPVRAGQPAFSATPTLAAMIQACCLDDVTLSHVFDVLRLSELVENQPTAASLEERAAVILTVVGELELVMQQLMQFDRQEPRDGARERSSTADPRRESALFLRHTQLLLLDFIAEAGRDRSTHMKELFSRVPCVPPRPRLWNLAKHAWMTPGAHQNTQGAETSQLSGLTGARFGAEALSDTTLEMSLQSGSLLAIWNRLHQLWDATRGKLIQRQRVQVSWANQLPLSPPESGAEAKIYWAVARSVRHMNRFRQLIFTRVLEMLCTPVTIPTASDQTTQIAQIRAPAPLIELVFAAFIQEAAPPKPEPSAPCQTAWKIPWPYEAESQREAILSCSQIDKTLRQRVVECLCIPDSMHFLQRAEDAPESHYMSQGMASAPQLPTAPPLVQTLPTFQKPLHFSSRRRYTQGDLVTLQDLGNIDRVKWTHAANTQLRRTLATSVLNSVRPRGCEDFIDV